MSKIKLLDGKSPPKIEWLRTFLAVIDSGGFTKASKAIRLSQPAVSTQVKELEKCLGTPLLDQVGGKLRLTGAGEIVAREARRMLEIAHDLQLAVSDAEETVQGTLTVGASTTPGNYLLPELLARFERENPRAQTVLSIGNSEKIVDRLRANEVDLGFVGFEPDADEFDAKTIWEDEIVPFASAGHPLAKKSRVPLEELARERFIVREASSATRRMCDRLMAKHGVHPSMLELSCPETVKRAVAAGLGIGLLSRFALGWEIKEGTLAILRVPGFSLKRPIYAVHHRRKHLTRALKAFLEMVESCKA
jgi:DNA-binding transcriptional LysR family regulator